MTGAVGDEAVEAIAQRVAEILRRDGLGGGLVDAAALARRLGVARSTVYERAQELGAVRIGNGPRARLRFDLQAIESSLASARPDPPAQPADGARVRTRRRRPARSAASLLPIRGQASR